jgi:hypothetical protein
MLFTKNLKKLSLYVRVMYNIPLLLRFKIDSKVFIFILTLLIKVVEFEF